MEERMGVFFTWATFGRFGEPLRGGVLHL